MNTTFLVKDQLSYYERILLLSNQTGLINLDPILNTAYLITPIGDISINIINVFDKYPKFNISDSCLVKLLVMILPLNNVNLIFDATMPILNMSNSNSVSLEINNLYMYTLFSFNSTLIWNVLPFGAFSSYNNISISTFTINSKTYTDISNSITDEIYFKKIETITL